MKFHLSHARWDWEWEYFPHSSSSILYQKSGSDDYLVKMIEGTKCQFKLPIGLQRTRDSSKITIFSSRGVVLHQKYDVNRGRSIVGVYLANIRAAITAAQIIRNREGASRRN